MPGGGRSFRRRCKKFRGIWIPSLVDEVHDVIHVDGIWFAKNVVILIACSKNYILSWYLARGENSQSYSDLLSKIAPPNMVVSDGGTGFAKAYRSVASSSNTAVSLSCVLPDKTLLQAYRPKLEAGVELIPFG